MGGERKGQGQGMIGKMKQTPPHCGSVYGRKKGILRYPSTKRVRAVSKTSECTLLFEEKKKASSRKKREGKNTKPGERRDFGFEIVGEKKTQY